MAFSDPVLFDVDSKIDRDDFQRQLDQANSLSMPAALREVITGQYDAAEKMREAKITALYRARAKLAAAVQAEHNRMVEANFLPTGANEDIQAWLDQGPLKVTP